MGPIPCNTTYSTLCVPVLGRGSCIYNASHKWIINRFVEAGGAKRNGRGGGSGSRGRSTTITE